MFCSVGVIYCNLFVYNGRFCLFWFVCLRFCQQELCVGGEMRRTCQKRSRMFVCLSVYLPVYLLLLLQLCACVVLIFVVIRCACVCRIVCRCAVFLRLCVAVPALYSNLQREAVGRMPGLCRYVDLHTLSVLFSVFAFLFLLCCFLISVCCVSVHSRLIYMCFNRITKGLFRGACPLDSETYCRGGC